MAKKPTTKKDNLAAHKGAAVNAFNAVAQGHLQAPDVRRTNLRGKRFVVTWAQAYTPVHPDFLKSLESYCGKNNAQLVVTTSEYAGKAKLTKEEKETTPKFDPKIQKYLLTDENKMSKITNDLVIGGELNISPTAKNPLSTLDNYFHGASGIVGHPRIAMNSLPGLGEDSARFLYTTGAVTQRNYKDGKAGQVAEFNHAYGALVVEVDNDGAFFVRQITADSTGAFYDLTDQYLPDGKVLHNQAVKNITLGDIHIEKGDAVQDEIVFRKGGVVETLKPEELFIHDLIDFTARNHHNLADPDFYVQQQMAGLTVEKGIDMAGAWLKAHERKGRKMVVTKGNHDEAYPRWLKEADARFDEDNSRFWHESNAQMKIEIEAGNKRFDILEWAIRRKTKLVNTEFLQLDDSYVTCRGDKLGGGIEHAMHGHIGLNGAKGSAEGLRRLPTKVTRGHDHSAGIKDGVYTVGVHASLIMGYNKGPSSWSHTHCIEYADGKRSMVTIREGKWRAACERVKVPALNQNRLIVRRG